MGWLWGYGASVEPVLFIGQCSSCSFHSFVAKLQRLAGGGTLCQICTVLRILPKQFRLFHRLSSYKERVQYVEMAPLGLGAEMRDHPLRVLSIDARCKP